jgi:hypothetical protein
MTVRFQPIDKLPLFASEAALACALLGPGRTEEWHQIVPLLERRGFPTVDGLMGGRYTPAVKAFWDREYRVSGEAQVSSAPHEPAELGAWKKTRDRRG